MLTHRVTLCQRGHRSSVTDCGGLGGSVVLQRLCAHHAGSRRGRAELEGRGDRRGDRGRFEWSVWCVCVAMSARVFRLTRLSFRRRRDHEDRGLGPYGRDLKRAAKNGNNPSTTRTVQVIWMKLRVQDPGISIKHSVLVL